MSKSFPQNKVFEGANNGGNGDDHVEQSVSQGVVIRAGLRRLVDCYVKREMGICLHFPFHRRDESIDGESGYVAIVFEKTVGGDANISDAGAGGCEHLGAGAGSPRGNDVQLPMPILSSPIAKNPKVPIDAHNLNFRGESFGSVVRLYRLDKGPTVLREWRNLPSMLLKIPRPEVNRELKMILIGGRVLAGLADGSRINSAVKSGSEVVEGFSEFERANRGDVSRWEDPDSPCPVVLHIYRRVIEVFIAKISPDFSQGFAMNACPINSVPTPLEF